jgi:hypothetical protein
VGTWSHRSRQSGWGGGGLWTTSNGKTPSVGHSEPCRQRRKWVPDPKSSGKVGEIAPSRSNEPTTNTHRRTTVFIYFCILLHSLFEHDDYW